MLRNCYQVVTLAVVLMLAASTGSLALVNLEWRPAQQTVLVGDTVVMGLYAVADAGDELMFDMDVLVTWDPMYLGPVSLGEPQPAWWSDFFGPWDVNTDLGDGDAMYTAWGPPGEPINVTSEGLLCATFEFTALKQTPGTVISIPAVLAQHETKVFSGTQANLDIKGTLGSGSVAIVPEPASLAALALGLAPLALRRKRCV